MERSLSLCREIGDINLRIQACLHAVNSYSWTGDLTHCSMVIEEIRKMAQSPTALPLMGVTWKWIEALMYNRSTESRELALRSISEGMEIAEKNGVHVWDQMLFSQGVYSSLNKRDMSLAAEFLKKMETTLEESRRHGLCQHHYLVAWYHLLTGNLTRAALSAETASKLAEETGMYFTKILCHIVMAQVLHEKGEYQNATTHLTLAKRLVKRSGSLLLEYMCLIKEAQFGLDRDIGKTEPEEPVALRKAMELGRKQGYLDLFSWWQPSDMTRLCTKALAEGIEVDYVQNLIRKHNLLPDVLPPDLENWPWSLKIFTLGKFELLKDEKPIRFSGKVQKKPLLVLKALIALGGKDIREEQIADLLWPEAEGDAAYSALTTTLFRLRGLMGTEKAIKVQEGKATLDPRYCWVDAWAFEKILEHIENLWENSELKENSSEMMHMTEKAIGLYKGHFLPADEGHFWTISCRERLQAKFRRLIIRLGDNLETARQWEKAVGNYQRGIEMDGLAEEFYQRLMVCHERLGQRAEAIAVYRRLKNTLSAVFGIGPSPKTKAIYKTIISSSLS